MYVLTKEIDNYLSSCRIQRGLDPKTLKAYRIDLKQYAAFVNMAEHPSYVYKWAGCNALSNSGYP